MDIEKYWEKALGKTEIVRARVKPLSTMDVTRLPYVFLAESALNMGDSVVRKGLVMVEKPSLILPDNIPSFEGFDFEKDFPLGEQFLNTFFMVRGIRFPSMKYNNHTHSLDIYEGKLQDAIDHYKEKLQQAEDIHTGLIVGPEDCWQLSIIIFICSQIMRQADGDIQRMMDEYRRKKDL